MIKEYNIASDVMAFSTTRQGGVSQGNYGEFNINEFCGDNPECVEANRKALAHELGVDENRILIPHQVHGVEVRQIAGEFLSMPENIRKMVLEGVDAIMTNLKNVCIGVSTFMPVGEEPWLASYIRPCKRWLLPTRQSLNISRQ